MPTPQQRRVLLSGGAAALTYSQKVAAIAPANLIDWSKMAEASGTTAIDSSALASNGTYTGVTLAQPGIGDELTAASFDGLTSFNNRYTAARAAALNGQSGTLAIWAKMSGAGVWTDTVTRILARYAVDGSNGLVIRKSNNNNQIDFVYSAGGASKSVSFTGMSGVTGWFFAAMTWDLSGDAMKAYLYIPSSLPFDQIGTTQTGLGTWAGALASTSALVGAFTTAPSNEHSGLLAHQLLYSTPLSLSQLAVLANP